VRTIEGNPGVYMALSKNKITPPDKNKPPIPVLLGAQDRGIDDDRTHRLNKKPLQFLES